MKKWLVVVFAVSIVSIGIYFSKLMSNNNVSPAEKSEAVITKVSPAKVRYGEEFTILGENLAPAQTSANVYLEDKQGKRYGIFTLSVGGVAAGTGEKIKARLEHSQSLPVDPLEHSQSLPVDPLPGDYQIYITFFAFDGSHTQTETNRLPFTIRN